MGIRNKDMPWRAESIEFSDKIMELIEPIFNTYSEKFTDEEIFYLITRTVDDIIIDKALELKYKAKENVTNAKV